MPFPRKFQGLIEATWDDVVRPDYAWLVWAVCAAKQRSCGWAGWVIESIYRKSPELLATTGRDELLPADYDWKCPRCKLPLFRTGVILRFEPSEDQTSIVGEPGVDYEELPITYTD
jgi:hypothetical protein